MENNLTKEQLQAATEIGNAYAASKGKSTLKEVLEPIKEGLNSTSTTMRDVATMQARATVEELSVLILKQELFTTPQFDYMNVVDVFNDGVVKEGNGKLYDFKNDFGSDVYNAEEFIPDAYTKTSVDEFTIQMYTKSGSQLQLSPQGYQFRKSIIYNQAKWIPYFKTGNLSAFIAMLQDEMTKSWRYFIFDKIMKRITSTGADKIGKEITSQATNAFDAWMDFLKVIRQMTTADTAFNQKQTQKNVMASNPADLLIFAHPDNIQTLQSGIKSQLFNAQFLDFKSVLNESNFINAGKKITNAGDSSQLIGVENDYYIPKNTIYVVHKNAIKHFNQLTEIATTFYARNLAIEWEFHKWGALDFLPWGQCFKFTCAALDETP